MPELDPISRRAFVDVVGRASPVTSPRCWPVSCPYRLVEHAEEAGVELLPYGGELGTACPCGGLGRPLRPRPRRAAPGRRGSSTATRGCCSACAGCPREDLLAELGRRRRVRDDELRRRPGSRGRRRRPGRPRAWPSPTTRRAEIDSPASEAPAQRAERHPVQHPAHRVVGDQAAVRGGVDQPERRVGIARARLGVRGRGAPAAAGRPTRRRTRAAAARTCSRASGGSDCQSRSWTTISDRCRRAKSTCQSISASSASAGRRPAAHPGATLVEQPLADVDQHLGQHGVLGREVPVERRAGDAARAPISAIETPWKPFAANSSAAVARICSRRLAEAAGPVTRTTLASVNQG